MFKSKLRILLGLAVGIGLLASHSFAYETGADSVILAVQTKSLEDVEATVEVAKAINTGDSERYAVLAASTKTLNAKYSKLLAKSRIKVTPDETKKFTVCTYDADTLKLLIESAGGGGSAASAASDRGRSNNSISVSKITDNWNSSGNHRANHRERQTILAQSLRSSKFSRIGTFPPGDKDDYRT